MRIAIAKEGIPYFGVPLLLSFVAFICQAWLLGSLLLLVGLFILYFFRDPERRLPADPNLLVSPADGRVVVIESFQDPELGPRHRISIFLSVFNVHINRIPYAGTVTRVQYFPGRFLAAFRREASLENERNTIELQAGTSLIRVTQIAGLIARRIVCWKRTGDRMQRGERLGMIRFGSRVDLDLPADTDLLIKIGDRLRGGSDPVARFRQ